MRRVILLGALMISVALLLGVDAGKAYAGCSFELLAGKEFDDALVSSFYLEGHAIPTQKRNAAVLKCEHGKRVVAALLDTSGYGTDVQEKYLGMAIVERKTSLGAAELAVGAYGFGIEKPAEGAEGPARVIFYNIAGEKVGETEAAHDKALEQPTPLQVVIAEGQPVYLYLGRYKLEIK
jgi:hypothetical protein